MTPRIAWLFQGKLTPLSASTLLASGGNPPSLSQLLAQQQPLPEPAASLEATSLCFEFVNRGSCSRLQRGEGCKYRHLPPTHPDVIADKMKQGKLAGGAEAEGGAPPKPCVQTYAGGEMPLLLRWHLTLLAVCNQEVLSLVHYCLGCNCTDLISHPTHSHVRM